MPRGLNAVPFCVILPAKFKPEPQEQFVPYWTAEPGWHNQLVLRNNLESGPLAVTPVLRLESGTEIPLAPVSIPPSSVSSVNLHDALMQSHPEVMAEMNAYGSVVIRYTALSHSNLYASAMVHNDGYPIVYHSMEQLWSPIPGAAVMKGFGGCRRTRPKGI